jgi:hypothetical protein
MTLFFAQFNKCFSRIIFTLQKKAAINVLALSGLNGELSSPWLIGGKTLITKPELLTANNNKRHIFATKLHFNGCLIGKEWVEKIPFTGILPGVPRPLSQLAL